MNDQGEKLQHATRAKIRTFNALRGKEVRPGQFWDLVVVTAVDESQRVAYELQITDKVSRQELPLGVDYKVFSDPPGPKVGNGGSTLYVLQRLDSIYGNALGKCRVLLIHAGGFSQRLPNASALGKVFTALPLCEPLYQMLELKLAMYVDFPSHMHPGVLVTCADDIEVYSISEDESVRFDKPGFTALGHPSPLSIGTTHGVFVLESSDKKKTCKEIEYISCLQFLHKPSIAEMRDTGAVCEKRGDCFSLTDDSFVYTDSTYYVDYATALLLLSLLKDIAPLRCEVDAYGDFLQALGPHATAAYTHNSANVHRREEGLVDVRQKIFRHLRGTPLNVILLNNSKFYHMGSTAEYLFHLTEDPAMRRELGLVSSAFSAHHAAPGASGSGAFLCVMHSVLEPGCSVAPGTVLEYCRLEEGVAVGTGSILSSCWVDRDLSVPDGVFMHSLCVTVKQQQQQQQARTGFVTVCFGIHDNLKQSVRGPAYMEELTFLGVSLAKCLSHWGMDDEGVKFSGDCSLWNARLFPVCSDLQSSFSTSLDLLQAVLKGSTFSPPSATKLMSMQEALQLKNLEEMLTFRKTLYNDIKQKRSIN
ncbi:hypothetical protein NHX12_033732 [Muraenolepis orangiensis]|uniref:GDP-fucose pyrophosphorylase domain-containing protein n=1 Tax=Muraenolepis orangiensis TaxID=630683 RepID=A0A9Q0E5P0_9TELE|nr:hypothetical protein NHX12_033732 [Muraenolepis orangiensis]